MDWKSFRKGGADVAGPGFPIVLTADRTLTAGYQLLFDGMLAASTTTTTPGFIAERLLMPRVAPVDGRAARAPLGLRRIEAALLRSGFSPRDVAVVEDADLASAIGAGTRVVGISAGEPMGRGMNSSTMTAIAGGRIVPHACFDRLLRRTRGLIAERAPGARVVLGGPGAWQIASGDLESLGVDHVVTGYAEANVAGIFRALVAGRGQPRHIAGEGPDGNGIPPIRAASTMGAIEISRGCGLGCHYCTIAREPMLHVPPETIMEDVRANIAAGQVNLSLLSEDVFRYGGKNARANPAALAELVRAIRAEPGVGLLQIDHANLSSIAQYSDEELVAIRQGLTGGPRHDYLWVNVGVETASGRLLKENGGIIKLWGCGPENWAEFSAAQVGRLMRAGYFPFVSLMIGLPGETGDDVAQTLAWVRRFRDARLAIFPVLYAPVDGRQPPGPGALTAAHWQLLRTCYRLNFRWIPGLYWDNQRGAGVPFLRRATLRCLGLGQIAQWHLLLRWNHWRARG